MFWWCYAILGQSTSEWYCPSVMQARLVDKAAGMVLTQQPDDIWRYVLAPLHLWKTKKQTGLLNYFHRLWNTSKRSKTEETCGTSSTVHQVSQVTLQHKACSPRGLKVRFLSQLVRCPIQNLVVLDMGWNCVSMTMLGLESKDGCSSLWHPTAERLYL